MRLKLLVVFLLSCGMANAQIGDYRSEFAIGFGGGYVMSSLDFVPEVPQLQHPGYIGGITMRYTSERYFNSICAIVGEVNYAKVGWKEDILDPDDEPVINSVTGEAEAYQRDQFYVQAPLMARLGWGRERKGFQVFFQAGPQFGYFLNETTKTNFNLNNANLSSRTSYIVAQDMASLLASVWSSPIPAWAISCSKAATITVWATSTEPRSATTSPVPTSRRSSSSSAISSTSPRLITLKLNNYVREST